MIDAVLLLVALLAIYVLARAMYSADKASRRRRRDQ